MAGLPHACALAATFGQRATACSTDRADYKDIRDMRLNRRMVSSDACLRVIVGLIETENKAAVTTDGVIHLQTQTRV